MIYKADTIRKWDIDVNYGDGRWIPGRPLGRGSIFQRLKVAWKVLIGKYDALDWEDKE